ncbi:alpha-amylase [Aspergillus sclerotialis]|uniref:alpha-amylase n=1 Tax=Aspergillus sclerotialis TaxID=2070753 RepID=A0A3A2ZKV8_9EURO|nr:alpha-amylase [Aspergillus sclerotialis]
MGFAKTTCTLLFLWNLVLGPTIAKSAAEWRELSIYQVVTDRFATNDGSAPDCWIRSYCGGTWKGLENKLDYIQGMGFQAVWISPIIHNIEENTTWGYAYHGYWGDNPYKLNPHFGTPDDLKSLSTALHKRRMSLMVDIVINHLAANQKPDNVEYSRFPAPFNSKSSFHQPCDIDYANQSSVEDCWLTTTLPPLVDVKSEDASVVDIVKTYNVDGIRLDTARHVPKQYLAQFQDAVGVFVTGEALNESVPFVQQYQGPLDSAHNYPLWYALVDTFTGRTTFDYLAAIMKTEEAVFSDINVLTNFLDNHDQPRMASRVGDDLVRDKNAVTFLMFTSGIPVLYYGFEQRFDGSADPVNREPMWRSDYNTNATLYQYISKLHEIRDLASTTIEKSSYFSSYVKVLGTSTEYMALQRGPLVVVVSNVGVDGTNNSFNIAASDFAPGSTIIDLFSCSTVKVGKKGSFVSPPNEGEARKKEAFALKLPNKDGTDMKPLFLMEGVQHE